MTYFCSTKIDGCWANVEQMSSGDSKQFQQHSTFQEQRKCCMDIE